MLINYLDHIFSQDVINVSKKYLPGMAKGFFSPKLTLHVGDGFEFMKKNQDAFDIIITDSSDPVGMQPTVWPWSFFFALVNNDLAIDSQTKHGVHFRLISFHPVTGPAESLFKESYYQLMKTALCEGGILCCQGWYNCSSRKKKKKKLKIKNINDVYMAWL